MTKAKSNLQLAKGSFSNHKFDTSGYVVLDLGVRRDAKTGQLMAHQTKGDKPKK
jgi:hypothetical protein